MMNKILKSLTRACREDQSGSALVELALSVPLFAMILLGAAEFARFTYVSIEVTNAARAGAQYAATLGGAPGDPDGIQNAAQNDAYNLGTGVTTSVFADTCVCSGAESTTVSCATASCPTGQHIMETVTIKATAQYKPIVSYGGLFAGISGMDGGANGFALTSYAKQMILPN